MRRERIVEVLRAAGVNDLICGYGNKFFVAGQEGVDYQNSGAVGVFQRNTLQAVHRLGYLDYSEGLTCRGEFSLNEKGRAFLSQI